jgi:HrpA-like RNA helicase
LNIYITGFVSWIAVLHYRYTASSTTHLFLYSRHTSYRPLSQHFSLPCQVVVATNAAESSITLPDVDVVICLGTHKALRYDQASHKVQLVNTWISKASSTQRAGRTGRVRPGKVFRLYSKHLFAGMQDHEESEIHRTPLQDVILGLRSMLEASVGFTGVVPILKDLLEPPDMRNVHKSFDYLHYAGMITVPDDIGALTSKGRLAGNLPVDLQLGCLIAYGVALGTYILMNVLLGCYASTYDRV